jgi:hypothetical protein
MISSLEEAIIAYLAEKIEKTGDFLLPSVASYGMKPI